MQKRDDSNQAAEMFSEMMKSATEMWGGNIANMQKTMNAMFGASQAKSAFDPNLFFGKGNDNSRIFNAFFSTLNSPDRVTEMLKSPDQLPNFLTGVAKRTWDAYMELQRDWMERTSKAGEKAMSYQELMDEDAFRIFREIYENEFSKFLNVPSLGLTRFYQERLNRVLDKYTVFQTALGEFIYKFYTPLEKASTAMQQELQELTRKGEAPSDFDGYYSRWVKVLEEHYFELLTSQEYLETLDHLVQKWLSFKSSREDLWQDILKHVPVPTNKEMDELYKDIYQMKKTIKTLTKKVAELESA